MDRRKFDVAFAGLLIFGALVILTSDSLVDGGVETELGSMFLPRIVAGFIAIFALMIGLPSLRKLLKAVPPGGLERIDPEGMLGVLVYLAILGIYWKVMPLVGFLAATPLTMFAIAWLLKGRNWLAMAAVSIITPVAIYYGSSGVLRIFLPAWSLS